MGRPVLAVPSAEGDEHLSHGGQLRRVRMRAVATIVPVRSLMTMRAGISVSTSTISISAIKFTGVASNSSGTRTRTVEESIARELLVNLSLSAWASRAAVVKSASRKINSIW